MAARVSLAAILELEELKKDTDVTKSVVSSAQQLLATDEEGEVHIRILMSKMREVYRSMFQSVKHCRLDATKKEKLWVLFHRFSIEEGFEMCNTCDKALSLGAPETFWQLLMEREFITMLVSQLQSSGTCTSSTHPSDSISSRNLSFIEENAVRYTAGYIVRKLQRKYSHQRTQEAIECCTALKGMAGKLKTCDNVPCASEHKSSEWTRLIDRGGLYHVEDAVYDLFVAIELIANKELSAIFEAKGKGLEKVKKDRLSWLCNDEDIQFLWCMISPTAIECEDTRQHLLREITHLWITTRGYSKARTIKEDYKRVKGKAVKGKHSLRKELACSVQFNNN